MNSMAKYIASDQNRCSVSVSQSRQAYFEQVWEYVRQVPYGKVVTYGQVSQALPDPQDADPQMVSIAQLVGSAMAASPADVPWHRVINAQGRVSTRADASRQIQLLEAEGLYFVQGRLDLNEHQWQGLGEITRPKQDSLF